MAHAFLPGMMITCNSRILRLIGENIASNRPLWGLLIMNEYFEASSPVAVAFRTRAKTRLQNNPRYKKMSKILDQVQNGLRLSDLSDTDQQTVRSIETGNFQYQKKLPDFQNRRLSFRRRQGELIRLQKTG